MKFDGTLPGLTYVSPQNTLVYGAELRMVASCYEFKGRTVTWTHPNYPEIYARDIARPRSVGVDSNTSNA